MPKKAKKRGRPKLKASQQKTEFFQLRVTKAQKRAYDKIAPEDWRIWMDHKAAVSDKLRVVN